MQRLVARILLMRRIPGGGTTIRSAIMVKSIKAYPVCDEIVREVPWASMMGGDPQAGHPICSDTVIISPMRIFPLTPRMGRAFKALRKKEEFEARICAALNLALEARSH